MQGVLTSREAWVRFACQLFLDSDLNPREIATAADHLLLEYLKRFPDPEDAESAKVTRWDGMGNPMQIEFSDSTDHSRDLDSSGVENE